MANSPQARKRAIQNEKRRVRNVAQRSRMRTFVKKALRVIEQGKLDEARTAFRMAESVIDKVANKGVVHKNTAARTKSRLAARLKALSQAGTAG